MTDAGYIEIPAGCESYILAHRSELDRGLRAAYAEVVRQDFAEIAPYLPSRAGRIIEIGCGLGALAVLLVRRYPDAQLTLIDGDGPAERMTGWYAPAPPTPASSRRWADELLRTNGAAPARWIDPRAARELRLRAELVVSLLSWGFHYPLSIYPHIHGDIVIADVRQEHRGAAEACFGSPAAIVRETDKFARMVWRPAR